MRQHNVVGLRPCVSIMSSDYAQLVARSRQPCEAKNTIVAALCGLPSFIAGAEWIV